MKSTTVISWKNTLNQQNLPTIGWWIGSFADLAMKAGYPYFAWSGRVYNTATGEDTGILAEDLD